ncbi:SWF/SNF helicase family protein, partial [Actinomadura soli]
AVPLTGLLRALLCKRLESSPAALAATAQRMADAARRSLIDLDNGVVGAVPAHRARVPARVAALWDGDQDTDDALDDLLPGAGPARSGRAAAEPATGYDQAALRADLRRDADILQRLADRARAVIDTDPKKDALAGLLLQALADPRGPKIVVFATARETTHDLGRWLQRLTRTDRRFAALRGRIATLGQRPEPSWTAAQQMLAGFAPATAVTAVTEATLPAAADRYDVLICTDKFSEGVNLQQAALCVNYDLSWNPQRLGQRVGRLDRVGSLHARVTCWTMLPSDHLDTILPIMDILIRKAHLAADTVGVPTPLFPGSPCQSYTSLLDAWYPHLNLPSHAPASRAAPSTAGLPDDGHSAADPTRGTGDRDDPAPLGIAGERNWAHAWLGNARRIPRLDTAITGLPAGSGSVAAAPDRDPSVVFCFRVHSADGCSHTAGFAQIYTGPRRAGHIILDTDRCLRQARIDPGHWTRAVGDGADPAHPFDVVVP